MSNEDGCEGSNKSKGGKRKEGVDEPAWAEESAEPRRDHDGRQHERDSGQGPQQGFASKIIACKEIGRRKSEKQGKKSGERRLIESEK
jgi:hypothetical protein